MKKTKKFIIILFISITILLLFSTIVRADIGINPEDYKTSVTTAENGEGLKVVGIILGIVRNLGAIAAVLAMAVIGLKYMLGAAEEKASYKENMILYITGCFLLVAATTLPNTIYNLAIGKSGGVATEGMVLVTFEYGTNSKTVAGYPGEALELPDIGEEVLYWRGNVEITRDSKGKVTKIESILTVDPYKFPDSDVKYTAFFKSEDGRAYMLDPTNNAILYV